jgi:hypothetical protein
VLQYFETGNRDQVNLMLTLVKATISRRWPRALTKTDGPKPVAVEKPVASRPHRRVTAPPPPALPGV